LLNVVIHAADVQDRDGARLVLDRRTRRLFPFIERIFADAGYQGPALAAAVAKTGAWALEIVKRNELHRFVVLPKRWIVERTLAWISRNPASTGNPSLPRQDFRALTAHLLDVPLDRENRTPFILYRHGLTGVRDDMHLHVAPV
jgi:transposase